MKYSKEVQSEARETLRKILNKDSQVFATVRHVSRSGMRRVISFWTPIIDKETGRVWMRWLDGYICKSEGYTFNKAHEGITVDGCGMDMGFSILYNLCSSLWGREAGEGWDNMAQRKEWL